MVASSWFVELFVLHFGSRLGATHRPLGGGGSSEDLRLVSPARVEKRGRIRGSSGRNAAHGDLDPARSRWSPGPDNLKTTRGGEVRVRL